LFLKKYIKKLIREFNRDKTDVLLDEFISDISMIDIGSSYFIDNKWHNFLRSKKVTWISIEPNDDNLDYLKNWNYEAKLIVKNICLSNQVKEKTLYVTKIDSGSSLKKPNIHSSMKIRMKKTNENYLFPYEEKKIKCETLNNIILVDKKKSYFLKIDTQGSELDILEGSDQLIKSQMIIGLETEAPLWAKPNYENSGKFWQICEFLEKNNFEMLRIFPYQSKSRLKNKTKSEYINNECDAVFALRPDILKKLDLKKKINIIPFYYTYSLYEEILNFIEDNADVMEYIRNNKNLKLFYKLIIKKI
jgi:FkbM family methyltransferase